MLNSLKNYLQISKKLHTSAQPSLEQFEMIKNCGVDMVINLAQINSPGAIENESQIVTSNMMDYIHIPVDFNHPTSTELESFFNTMNQSVNKIILIHCAYNWRVSCFIYLYQLIENRIPEKDARDDMLKIWNPDETWESFIKINLSMYENKIK